MDNIDETENTAKISDSAYSNSCSNSQSRRSHSSKSTRSGSNSSGSSGYGGQQSTASSSNELNQQTKKEKDSKKKKQTQVETVADSQIEGECRPPETVTIFPIIEENEQDAMRAPTPTNFEDEKGEENMDIATPESKSVKDEGIICNISIGNASTVCTVNRTTSSDYDGFSCVISMNDGVVMYTTSSLTAILGFPKDMWIGRSFIDFVHPKDRNTFASQITSGLAVPKIVNGTQAKDQSTTNQGSTMVCRIRRYRGLSCGFGVKEASVFYMPFLLKLSFKNVSDDDPRAIYLVIQTTPYFSAFKTPNEVLSKVVPFVMRHDANGILEYIDPESVPYLGYLPQDVTNSDALQLYHPGDLGYLQQVYEMIVKEGCVNRSKPYRLLTHNGDYITVETEWSAFINPWSKKLEFVTAKHYIIEGPTNPDVFEYSEPEKSVKLTEEEKNMAKMYKDSIIRIMNEVLTKPAEIAKQQMSKRCNDLASFMESLLEEQPKVEDDLLLEIQDADNSFYERDSVMLGGISPHHDYNDSKSSTETLLSYNQLNYNDTLQRYFSSHPPTSFVRYNSMPPEFIPDLLSARSLSIKSPSPTGAQNSGCSGELTGLGESGLDSGMLQLVDDKSPVNQLETSYQHTRLTETLLTKHNAEMERELMKIHREHRSSSKGDREKVSNEARQKKKEHLARCNATFQIPTALATTSKNIYKKPAGVKRSLKHIDGEESANKHRCTSPRQSRLQHSTSAAPVEISPTITTSIAPHWSGNPVHNMNTFILGVGIPQQMSIMSPVPAVSGVFPMFYTPTATPATITSSDVGTSDPNNLPSTRAQPQFSAPPVQCMMYGQPVYGSPFMYSPINPQNSYLQQTLLAPTMHYNNVLNPLCLTNSNYEEACRASIPLRPTSSARRDKKRAETQVNKNDQTNVDAASTSQNRRAALNIASEKVKPSGKLGNEENMDRTDGESSYSSFYSSFFKTESGSAEESSDAKKAGIAEGFNKNGKDALAAYNEQMKALRRKMEPPWMEQVSVTSELVYKYQIMSKSKEEVLSADKQKLEAIEQPSLVNEQLGQLYLDLQLEGVASRLTLEEGITSSSSSGEETVTTSKIFRKKREYSKLVMIHEENAPLPSPPEDQVSVSGVSTI